MGLGKLFRKLTHNDSKVSIGSSLSWADLLSMSTDKALMNSAFWICLMNLARTFGSLPMHVYERMPDGSRRSDHTSAESILLKHPCPYMNPYSFRFAMSINFEMYSVAYAKIGRSSTGKPIALYPIAPTLILPTTKDGQLYYQHTTSGEMIPKRDMLVMLNLTTNGIVPLAPLDYIRADLALAESAKNMQTNFFARGTMLGGIVSVPANTEKAVKDEIKAAFQSGFGGSSNSFKTAVVPETIKYEPVKIDSKSAEFLEAQKWTVSEVARRFGVPEAFAGGSIRETYANAEQRGIDLVQYSILPRSVAWQDGIDFALFPSPEKRYVKINLNGLMRGDVSVRSMFYHNGIVDGWLCANDVRALEDMDPIPHGDLYMVPMNYVPRSIAATTNPYTMQAVKAEQAPHGSSEETRNRIEDQYYLSERTAVAASQRKAIERLVRKQLKLEIDALQALIAEKSGPADLLAKFRLATEKIARDFGDQYVAAFADIAKKIQPIVQRQVKTGAAVDQDAYDKFIKAYGYKAADRHAVYRQIAVTNAVAGVSDEAIPETVDAMTQSWVANIPASESAEESHRSMNAMTVFLYGALGVSYMHVVANSTACDFCKKLDGKVVEVNGTILQKGDDVDDGEGNVLHISKSMKHPPFHDHCECGVAPGR